MLVKPERQVEIIETVTTDQAAQESEDFNHSNCVWSYRIDRNWCMSSGRNTCTSWQEGFRQRKYAPFLERNHRSLRKTRHHGTQEFLCQATRCTILLGAQVELFVGRDRQHHERLTDCGCKIDANH